MNDRVSIYEVGPRDGLQNEAAVIPVADKVALIDLLTGSGVAAVEVGSFVSPKWVPQMADTDKVLSAISYANRCKLGVLVPNMRGLQALQEATVDLDQGVFEVAVFVSASEGFSMANLNCTIEESFDRIAPVVDAAQAGGFGVRGYVSCVTDCPFDGPTDPEQVAVVTRRLRAIAPMSVSLGDTIGKATPETVAPMLDAVLGQVPAEALAGHFHDTGGRALDNIETALDRGVRIFDSSVGGLGGCPYAPGASGNVATGAVIERVEALGFDTGVDRDVIARASEMARTLKTAG